MKRQLILLTGLCLLAFNFSQVQAQDYVKFADDCFEKGDYECAKRNYNIQKVYGDKTGMDEKIAICDKCSSFLTMADVLFETKDYVKAKEQYEGILALNPKDPHAKTRIDACNAAISVNTTNDIKPVHVTTNSQPEKVWFSVKDGMESQDLMAKIENYTTTLLTACNEAIVQNKKPNFPADIFAKNSRQQMLDFWDTSPMYSLKEYISERCIKKSSGGYQVRNIPVSFPGAPEENREQEIVINYTFDGKIDDIVISVSETRYRELLEEYSTVEDFNRREIIIGFIENFRTAYNRKDLKYIESVFSDQALIITGKVVKVAQTKDVAVNLLLGNEKIVYTTQTKKEYVTNLKNTFTKNKYIDIVFEDIEVMRHPKNDKLYGVTLKQKWGSSTYNDTGYLFLMVDFKDEAWPMIHVRTWQPDKVDGRDLRQDELFQLNDFNIQNL